MQGHSSCWKATLTCCFHLAADSRCPTTPAVAVLWIGGRALFADLVTVGGVLTLLTYVTMMERGIKQVGRGDWPHLRWRARQAGGGGLSKPGIKQVGRAGAADPSGAR